MPLLEGQLCPGLPCWGAQGSRWEPPQDGLCWPEAVPFGFQFLESQLPSPSCVVSRAGTGEGASDPARSRVLTRVRGHLLGDFLDSLLILPLNPSSLLSSSV